MVTLTISIFGLNVFTRHFTVPLVSGDLPTLDWKFRVSVFGVELSTAPTGTVAPPHSIEVQPASTANEHGAPQVQLPASVDPETAQKAQDVATALSAWS